MIFLDQWQGGTFTDSRCFTCTTDFPTTTPETSTKTGPAAQQQLSYFRKSKTPEQVWMPGVNLAKVITIVWQQGDWVSLNAPMYTIFCNAPVCSPSAGSDHFKGKANTIKWNIEFYPTSSAALSNTSPRVVEVMDFTGSLYEDYHIVLQLLYRVVVSRLQSCDDLQNVAASTHWTGM